MKRYVEYVFVRFIAMIVAIFPWSAGFHVGKAIGSFVFYVVRFRRRLTFDNLRRAFPDASEEELTKIGLECYQSLFVSMLEIYWFERLTPQNLERIMTIISPEVLEKAREQGKGVILITAHFGNWELGAVRVGLAAKAPLTVIVQEQSNRYVNDFINRARAVFGNRPVLMRDAPREIIRALRRNEFVGIVADQSAAREAVRVRFFGRMAPTHDGPAVFCLRTGAPIIMAYATRLANGLYAAKLEEVDLSGIEGTDEEKIREITQRHASALEAYIRKYPGQWLWLHKRWKHCTD
jgi:KDO2-lipid IV(A) lauroyltransferase